MNTPELIELMTQELEYAIDKEFFEIAALIRDYITELKQELKLLDQ